MRKSKKYLGMFFKIGWYILCSSQSQGFRPIFLLARKNISTRNWYSKKDWKFVTS